MDIGSCFNRFPVLKFLITDASGRRHIDTARYYQNEGQVGQAIRQSGVPREEVFVSKLMSLRAAVLPESERCADFNTATKVFDQDQGYESTLHAVDDSLKNFGYGKSPGFTQSPSSLD